MDFVNNTIYLFFLVIRKIFTQVYILIAYRSENALGVKLFDFSIPSLGFSYKILRKFKNCVLKVRLSYYLKPHLLSSLALKVSCSVFLQTQPVFLSGVGTTFSSQRVAHSSRDSYTNDRHGIVLSTKNPPTTARP